MTGYQAITPCILSFKLSICAAERHRFPLALNPPNTTRDLSTDRDSSSIAACTIATTSLVGPGNLFGGAVPYPMLTTRMSSLLANPPPYKSRCRGRISPDLWDLGMKIRFRKCGRHGEAFTIVGRSSAGVGQSIRVILKPRSVPIFRAHRQRKYAIRIAIEGVGWRRGSLGCSSFAATVMLTRVVSEVFRRGRATPSMKTVNRV